MQSHRSRVNILHRAPVYPSSAYATQAMEVRTFFESLEAKPPYRTCLAIKQASQKVQNNYYGIDECKTSLIPCPLCRSLARARRSSSYIAHIINTPRVRLAGTLVVSHDVEAQACIFLNCKPAGDAGVRAVDIAGADTTSPAQSEYPPPGPSVPKLSLCDTDHGYQTNFSQA